MSSFSSHAYKYVDFRSTVKASAAERTLPTADCAPPTADYALFTATCALDGLGARCDTYIVYLLECIFGELVLFCTVSRLV